MIRRLISRFSKSFNERVVSHRKPHEVPVRIWFEPDRNTGSLKLPSENLVMVGETRDLSKSGIAFVVPAIRINEYYLVGEGRTLNVELDLSGERIGLKVVGSRYEQVGEHASTAQFLVGARITSISESARESYEYFLRTGGSRKRGSLVLGVDER